MLSWIGCDGNKLFGGELAPHSKASNPVSPSTMGGSLQEIQNYYPTNCATCIIDNNRNPTIMAKKKEKKENHREKKKKKLK